MNIIIIFRSNSVVKEPESITITMRTPRRKGVLFDHSALWRLFSFFPPIGCVFLLSYFETKCFQSVVSRINRLAILEANIRSANFNHEDHPFRVCYRPKRTTERMVGLRRRKAKDTLKTFDFYGSVFHLEVGLSLVPFSQLADLTFAGWPSGAWPAFCLPHVNPPFFSSGLFPYFPYSADNQ